MKILFVFSELSLCYGSFLEFAEQFVSELRSRAEVVCIFFNFFGGNALCSGGFADYVFSSDFSFDVLGSEAKFLDSAACLRAKSDFLLKDFSPDVIQCNDSLSCIPFRFDANVFYSSGFECVLTSKVNLIPYDFLYTQIVKNAFLSSAAASVFSNSCAFKAFKLSGVFPVVIPPSLNLKKNSIEKILQEDVKKICFVCSDSYSNTLICTLKELSVFFRENGIEVCVFSDNVCVKTEELSVFCDFKKLFELKDYSFDEFEIVVLFNDCEEFYFFGLKAFGAGSLLLLLNCEKGYFYTDDKNCILLLPYYFAIAKLIKNCVLNFANYDSFRENALSCAERMSLENTVDAYIFVYSQIIKDRVAHLYSAYRCEAVLIEMKYKSSNFFLKKVCAEKEKNLCIDFIRDFENSDKNVKTGNYFNEVLLLLTCCYSPDKEKIPRFVRIVSVLGNCEGKRSVKLECLPFENNSFECVCAVGAWGCVVEPCTALMEMQRVAKNEVVIMYEKYGLYPWQIASMEKNEWIGLNKSNWDCSFSLNSLFETENNENFSLKRKISGKRSFKNSRKFYYSTDYGRYVKDLPYEIVFFRNKGVNGFSGNDFKFG